MPSDHHDSTVAKATCLILSLFDVASAWEVPFGILQYIQYILHGLTSALLCVPADNKSVNAVVHMMASSSWKLHTGYFDYTVVFQILLDLYWLIMSWQWSYFSFQTIIDWGAQCLRCGLRWFTIHNNYFQKKVNKLVY